VASRQRPGKARDKPAGGIALLELQQMMQAAQAEYEQATGKRMPTQLLLDTTTSTQVKQTSPLQSPGPKRPKTGHSDLDSIPPLGPGLAGTALYSPGGPGRLSPRSWLQAVIWLRR